MKTTDYTPVCSAADAGKRRIRTAAAGCGVLIMMLPSMLGQFGVQAGPPSRLPAALLRAPEHSHSLDDCGLPLPPPVAVVKSRIHRGGKLMLNGFNRKICSPVVPTTGRTLMVAGRHWDCSVFASA